MPHPLAFWITHERENASRIAEAILYHALRKGQKTPAMQYILFVDEGADRAEADKPTWWARTVPPGEEAYLRALVFPTMRLLSPEDYRSGPATMRNTAARWSYVLDGSVVYWCVEWEPGLVVVRFTPDGSLAWAQIRSPNPQFGGREATEEETGQLRRGRCRTRPSVQANLRGVGRPV